MWTCLLDSIPTEPRWFEQENHFPFSAWVLHMKLVPKCTPNVYVEFVFSNAKKSLLKIWVIANKDIFKIGRTDFILLKKLYLVMAGKPCFFYFTGVQSFYFSHLILLHLVSNIAFPRYVHLGEKKRVRLGQFPELIFWTPELLPKMNNFLHCWHLIHEMLCCLGLSLCLSFECK